MTARREELLRAAARLFAERGFRATTIEDVGAAVGISGPAVYKHFASKDAVLASMLVGISERLLAGGREQVAAAGSDREALARLVAFHTDFALHDPDLIRVQDRDLASLSLDAAAEVRRLQRAYLQLWAQVLERLRPGLAPGDARTAVQAAFGLLNSTGHLGRHSSSAGPRREVLQEMALAALSAVVDR